MATTHDRIVRLFTEHFGAPPAAIVEMGADGSSRGYYRLVGPAWETAVGAIGPDREENRAFLSYSYALRAAGLPVPEIYAADEAVGVWLEEDLGDTTLFDALMEARSQDTAPFPDAVLPIYRQVVRLLPRFQVDGARVIDYSVAYPRAAFDLQSILWDLNYFKYHFLKLAHVPFSEARLESDFKRLARFLLGAETRFFLYRDFQSRNIMVRDEAPWFIDYQGGRRGAAQYDIASLLYDAKAAIPEDVRDHLLDEYLDAFGTFERFDRKRWLELYRGYVLVRIMQAMGAYGYRGFFERKPRFLQSVPHAARNIRRILERGLPVQIPELADVFEHISDRWGGADGEDERPGLTVRVGSFSYKRGYPEDSSGHGGGFVFDCRALPNPGRLLEYRTRCGRDQDVCDFLDASRETGEFWERVRGLTDAQIEEYVRRGFSRLSVWFGCTGGQHRSVYFAERLARHIRERFDDVHVDLMHREEHSWPREPADSPT